MLPKRPSIFYHGMQTTVPNKKAYFCIRIVEEYVMPNLPTNIVDFNRFDSSTILISRGEIRRPIEDFPESLSQAM